MPNKKPKLSIPVLDTLDESQVTALRDTLLASDKEDVRNLLLYLMSSSGILGLKLSLGDRPSFSSVTWAAVCREFNLDSGNGPGQLAQFDVPQLFLPPSVHKRILTAAMRTMDVYREPQSHNNETARVRLFEAWHVPLCQLFRGRIVDKPEERLPGTTLTSGGFVEHELYVLDLGLIMLVYELRFKLCGLMGEDEVAQVFMEMHAAWASNSDRNLSPQPPVYALLTDLDKFFIYKFDGKIFTRLRGMSTFGIGTEFRQEILLSMMPVAERLFSVILHGFIEYLDAVRDKSKRRGEAGDTSPENLSQVTVSANETKTPAPRRSFDKWNQAHMLAVWARVALTRPPQPRSRKDAEYEGQKGLDLLDQSVFLLTKIGSLSDWKEPKVIQEVESLLDTYFV